MQSLPFLLLVSFVSSQDCIYSSIFNDSFSSSLWTSSDLILNTTSSMIPLTGNFTLTSLSTFSSFGAFEFTFQGWEISNEWTISFLHANQSITFNTSYMEINDERGSSSIHLANSFDVLMTNSSHPPLPNSCGEIKRMRMKMQVDADWIRWYWNEVLVGEMTHALKKEDEMQVQFHMEGESEMTLHTLEIFTQNNHDKDDHHCPYIFSPTGQSTCDEKKRLVNARPSSFLMSAAPSLDDIETYLHHVEAEMGEAALLSTIGQSVQNRSIYVLCIGLHCKDTQNGTVPAVLFTGMHHAREPMSMLNLLYTMQTVIESRTTTIDVWTYLSSTTLYFIPVVNPDAYVYNFVNNPSHNTVGARKNRQKTCPLTPENDGIDLNRNYDVCFSRDNVGSSDILCQEDYRGPTPFSEPETKSMKAFIETHTNIRIALNYHSFGNYVNIPFACQGHKDMEKEDRFVYNALAGGMTIYNKYAFGQSWENSDLYVVNGEASDWMYAAHGIYAMSPETGPAASSESLMLWPSDPEMVQGIVMDQIYPNLYLMTQTAPSYTLNIDSISTPMSYIDVKSNDTTNIVAVRGSLSSTGLENNHAEVQMVGASSLNSKSGMALTWWPNKSPSLVERSGPVVLEMPIELHSDSSWKTYLILYDGKICTLVRIVGRHILERNQSTWSVSEPHTGPSCGACRALRKNIGMREDTMVEKDCIELTGEEAWTDHVVFGSNDNSTSIPLPTATNGTAETTEAPTTAVDTTAINTTEAPTAAINATETPTAANNVTHAPTALPPNEANSTIPTTEKPATIPPTEEPITESPATEEPTTSAPPTEEPTTSAPPTKEPTTSAPPTEEPRTEAPTTLSPTESPSSQAPYTKSPDMIHTAGKHPSHPPMHSPVNHHSMRQPRSPKDTKAHPSQSRMLIPLVLMLLVIVALFTVYRSRYHVRGSRRSNYGGASSQYEMVSTNTYDPPETPRASLRNR